MKEQDVRIKELESERATLAEELKWQERQDMSYDVLNGQPGQAEELSSRGEEIEVLKPHSAR